MSKTNIEIKIDLKGPEGNAFFILGVCRQGLERYGMRDKWEEFKKEATSGNYQHLLQTVKEWFDAEFEGEDLNNEDECDSDCEDEDEYDFDDYDEDDFGDEDED